MFPRFVQGLKNKFRYAAHTHDEDKTWQQFQFWYTSPLGKRFAESEKGVLDETLPDLFGYYLLQCGCPEVKVEKTAGNWLQSSRVSSQYCLDFHNNQGVSFQSSTSKLPIQSDSLDIVVLPHVLDFSSEPHQVLREVERILIAEGNVVILGFNPWSLWNISRQFLYWTKQAPWNARFLSKSRVIDWLALLGFDVVKQQGYFYLPPLQSENIINKMGLLEKVGQRIWPNFGAGYVLVACKRVETLTPIRPRWRARAKRQFVASGLKPINRNKM